MAEDKHLGTGEYDPEKYWSERARKSRGSCFSAVCVFFATDEENRAAHRLQESVVRKELKRLDLKGKDVLEYGCGVGRWIHLFKQLGTNWKGVDISEDMLSLAMNEYKDVELKKVTDDTIPYPEKSMDLVYSITVLHHNTYNAQERIASEMVRVLRDGGYVLILEDLGQSGEFNLFPRERESWVKLFENHGMSLCSRRGVRYWLLRGLAYGMVGRFLSTTYMPNGGGSSSGPTRLFAALRKFAGLLDLLVDPYINGLVPKRYYTGEAMVFRKS